MRNSRTLVLVAAAAAGLGYPLAASSPSAAAPRHPPGTAPGASPPLAPTATPQIRDRLPGLNRDGRGAPRRARHPVPVDVPRVGRAGGLGEADGALPDGTTVFDDEMPGVARLDPALLGALRRAVRAAADDGVELFVNSGWRSPEYQERLLDEAVSKYGSEVEAARWVATPTTSVHVSGDAADIGPFAGAEWLAEHGDEYGLCQVYGNEPWHYELRPEAIGEGCPRLYPDPTHDPRMQPRPSERHARNQPVAPTVASPESGEEGETQR